MNIKIITIVILTLLITGCSWNPFRRNQTPTPTPSESPSPTQTASQVREELERTTGLTLPTLSPASSQVAGDATISADSSSSTTNETVLTAVEGDGRAYATRTIGENSYQLTVLADLPDPEAGTYYQVWLVRGQEGQENYQVMKVGRLQIQKAGYLLEYNSRQTYGEYQQVVVSRETSDDAIIETLLLDGSF